MISFLRKFFSKKTTVFELGRIRREATSLSEQTTLEPGQKAYRVFVDEKAEPKRLAANTHFEIHAVRLGLDPDTSPEDIEQFSNNGWFRFFIGVKDRLVVNNFMLMDQKDLMKIKPCCDGCEEASVKQAIQVTCGRPDQRGIYVLAEPVDLIPGQSFWVELGFPGGLATASPITAHVHFDGFLKEIVT